MLGVFGIKEFGIRIDLTIDFCCCCSFVNFFFFILIEIKYSVGWSRLNKKWVFKCDFHWFWINTKTKYKNQFQIYCDWWVMFVIQMNACLRFLCQYRKLCQWNCPKLELSHLHYYQMVYVVGCKANCACVGTHFELWQ